MLTHLFIYDYITDSRYCLYIIIDGVWLYLDSDLCLFGSNRTQEWSELSRQWEHCCKCPKSSVDHFPSLPTHKECQMLTLTLTKYCYVYVCVFVCVYPLQSTDTLRPGQDISSKDGGGSPESRSTTGSTDTTVTSAVSTRPVLTRQGKRQLCVRVCVCCVQRETWKGSIHISFILGK